MAQAEVNGSQEVVDATNAEISAVENLANAKENISSNSIQKRANMESILADNNAKTMPPMNPIMSTKKITR